MSSGELTSVRDRVGGALPVLDPSQRGYTRVVPEKPKGGPSREELREVEDRALMEAAKVRAKQEGKEELDIEKYVKLRFGGDPRMLTLLRDPSQIEDLEYDYYVLKPKIKTITAFVNNEISEMGRT
ncbi:MAG: hypothetical protein M1511_13080 [Deltaproteobacteria bacterium]|nr:hypothetical protein [Deltaproteobacteria bacterium]